MQPFFHAFFFLSVFAKTTAIFLLPVCFEGCAEIWKPVYMLWSYGRLYKLNTSFRSSQCSLRNVLAMFCAVGSVTTLCNQHLSHTSNLDFNWQLMFALSAEPYNCTMEAVPRGFEKEHFKSGSAWASEPERRSNVICRNRFHPEGENITKMRGKMPTHQECRLRNWPQFNFAPQTIFFSKDVFFDFQGVWSPRLIWGIITVATSISPLLLSV